MDLNAMVDGKRQCKRCLEEKPLTDFAVTAYNRAGDPYRRHVCKACEAAAKKNRMAEKPIEKALLVDYRANCLYHIEAIFQAKLPMPATFGDLRRFAERWRAQGGFVVESTFTPWLDYNECGHITDSAVGDDARIVTWLITPQAR